MIWPFRKSKPERREAIGGYTEIISRLVEAQAAGTTHQASATAATEAAAGALSRAFASATVEAPADIAAAVTPHCLALIGRDLIQVGESFHVLRYGGGRLRLHPASTWYWEGDADPDMWLCTATVYDPSGSVTWRVPIRSCSWYLRAPLSRALSGVLGGRYGKVERERRADPRRRSRRADRATAPGAARRRRRRPARDAQEGSRGRPREGAAPQADWKQQRMGPAPTEPLVKLAQQAFERVLAASGTPPSLFMDSDGTAQREAVRRWHLSVVLPLARLVEHELTRKLKTEV